jgi:hypothetical protein
VPLGVTMTPNIWYRLWGSGLIVVGVVWIRKREVEVGVAGRPPAFFVRGRAAVVCGAIVIAIGVVVFVYPGIFEALTVRF